MTTARSNHEPALDPNASVNDLDDSVADIMPKIDGAAGDDTGEMMVVDAGASDAVPLLAPTSSTPELAEIRPVPNEDSNRPRRSPLLGTIFLSGCIRKCPEKSMKSDAFQGFGVHRHPAEFVEIDGTLRYI